MQFQQNQKVAITNATIAVAGNVNATITNASIPVTGNVSISGTPNVNVTGGSITITAGTLNVTTVGTITNPVTVLNDVNTLINVSYQFNLGNYQNTFTAGTAAAGLRLVLLPSLLNLDIGGTIGIFINNNTNNSIYQSTGIIGKFPPYGAGGSSGFQVDIPIAVDAGDSISITLTDNQGGLGIGNATKIILLGLSNPPQITTSPGQPVNVTLVGGISKTTQTLAAAGTVALLPAPPTGTAYRLMRGVFAGAGVSTAGATQKIVGHTSGVRCMDFNCVTAAGIVPSHEDLGGVLYAEGVDFVCTVAGATCDLHYDVVAVPVVQ